MEYVLTGKTFTAQEASDWGLISRVVSDKHDETLQEAIKVAERIASKGKISVQAAKEAVNHGELHLSRTSCSIYGVRVSDVPWIAAFELPLHQGLTFERRLFHMLFATVSHA